MSRIVSFRGLIAAAGIDTVALPTINGATGYKIIKMEMLPNNPGTETPESVVKIYKVPQTTATAVIDFSDQTLVAAGIYHGEDTPNYPQDSIVVFDGEIFNQDVYITHKNTQSATSMNYYIELEQMPLDLNENTVATLKDIRNVA